MIGLTPVPIYDRFQSFDVFEESPALLRIGDRVKFTCVDDREVDQIRQQVWECNYKFSIKSEIFSL
jgi:allophanate hydrolase subunit 1